MKAMSVQKPKPSIPGPLLKPKLDTKFHIDYEWWDTNSDIELRSYLLSHLPQEERENLEEMPEDRQIDYVDPETGEVFRLDALGLALQEAAKDEDFINAQISLVDSVFRVFLKNGNKPLSPQELEPLTERPASTILKTLGGIKVYRGIRPIDLG